MNKMDRIAEALMNTDSISMGGPTISFANLSPKSKIIYRTSAVVAILAAAKISFTIPRGVSDVERFKILAELAFNNCLLTD